MNTTTAPTPATSPANATVYRPKFALYHASPKGTGAALKMSLHPAHDDVDGSIMLTLAPQATIGDRRGPNPVYPRFQWEAAVTVKLDFSDLSKFLQVFRGEMESIEDGKGLFHTTSQASTRIVLRHLVEPISGYSLEIFRTPRSGEEEVRLRFFFSGAEACGLTEAIASSMGVIAFGIPMVVPHDTSAYRTREREVRNEGLD